MFESYCEQNEDTVLSLNAQRFIQIMPSISSNFNLLITVHGVVIILINTGSSSKYYKFNLNIFFLVFNL